jgi:hypothetical protein
MIHPEFLLLHAVSTSPRHCEARSRVNLESIQSSIASSPKQSPRSEFAANPEQGDCHVASSLRNSVNTNPCQIYPNNAPRNDKLKRDIELALSDTLYFGNLVYCCQAFTQRSGWLRMLSSIKRDLCFPFPLYPRVRFILRSEVEHSLN